MVEGEDPVEFAAAGAGEKGVGALRAVHVEAAGTGGGHRRHQEAAFLLAQQAAFTGVRVEPRESDLAAGMAIQAVEGLGDRVPVHRRVDRLAQWYVHGEQRHLEAGRQEGHQVVAAVALQAAGLGQVVGVPLEAGEVLASDRLLAHRRGDQGVGGAGAHQGDAGVERRHGSGGVGRPGEPKGDVTAHAHRIEDRDEVRSEKDVEIGPGRRAGEPVQPVPGSRGEELAQPFERGALRDEHGLPGEEGDAGRIGQQLEQDLRTDSRGVALGECEAGAPAQPGVSQ